MYIWASSVAAIWWVLLSRDLSELARRDADGNIRVPVRRLTRRGVGAVIGWNVEKVPRNFEWRRFLWFSGLAEASLAVSFIPWTWLRVVCLVLLSLFAILIWSTMVHDGVVYQKEESRWQGDQDGTVDIKYREEERTPRRKDMLLILIPTVLGLSLSSTVSLAINSTWWRWGLIHGLLCLFVVVLFVRAQRNHSERERHSWDYCERCDEKYTTRIENVVHREHVHGDFYTETTEQKALQTCPRCEHTVRK